MKNTLCTPSVIVQELLAAGAGWQKHTGGRVEIDWSWPWPQSLVQLDDVLLAAMVQMDGEPVRSLSGAWDDEALCIKDGATAHVGLKGDKLTLSYCPAPKHA